MGSPFGRASIRKYWWILAIVLVLIIWIRSATLNASFLEGVLNRTLTPATRGLYYTEIGEVSFSLLRGRFSVGDLYLRLDDAVFDSLESLGEAPAIHFSGELGEASIENVSLMRLLFSKELEAERFRIKQPKLRVTAWPASMSREAGDPDSATTERGAESGGEEVLASPPVSLDQLPPISVEQLIAEDVDVKLSVIGPYGEDDVETDLSSRIEGLSFTLHNLHVDQSRLADPRRLALTADAELAFSALHLELADQTELDVDTFQASTLDATLALGRVTWTPSYTKEGYLAGAGASRDRIAASVGPIHLSGVGYHSLVSHLMLHVDKGQVGNLWIDVLSDKQRESEGPADAVAEQFMPHSFMQELPIGLQVDTLDVADASITYSERGLKGSKVGSISIDNLNATVSNVSNRGRPSEPNDATGIEATARLFGSTPVNVHIAIPLMDRPPSMRLSARASAMDPQVVNSILPALEGMRITGGTVDTAWLDIDYGPEMATGHVTAIYRDLKVRIESPETGEQNLGTKIVTVGAKLGLRGANDPKPGKPPRAGKVDYKISLDKPFFETFWEAIRDGLLSLVSAI